MNSNKPSEGALIGPTAEVIKSTQVPFEHGGVTEQPVTEQHGLGSLKVCVARKHHMHLSGKVIEMCQTCNIVDNRLPFRQSD